MDDLDISGDKTVDATMGLRRAEELYERVFGEYGDDSVAQLGGVHLACEQASNVLTKVLERGRLMSYLEQSTRYIPYDTRLWTGHFRYFRDPDVLESPLGARYIGEMDRMFDTYGELMPLMVDFLTKMFPREGSVSDFAYKQSIRARALDSLRGLLPAGALSNVGIYGSGQSYEMLLLRMRAHPLPEVRSYADLMLIELRKVIPSFLTRVDRPDRGLEWSDYFADRQEKMPQLVGELFDDLLMQPQAQTPSVSLIDFDPNGEDKIVAAICYSYLGLSEHSIEQRVATMSVTEKEKLLTAYVGDRRNRRHRPGRAFERTDYRFDIVSDYGSFRDLQRHRMMTIDWQPLTTDLGYEVPQMVIDAGLSGRFRESLDRSRDLYEALAERLPEQARYAVALAFNIRYIIQLSAREAMHVTELRSGPQGHPNYRIIAQQMHQQIASVAGHRGVAAAMRFVDYSDSDLGRLAAESRLEERRQSGS